MLFKKWKQLSGGNEFEAEKCMYGNLRIRDTKVNSLPLKKDRERERVVSRSHISFSSLSSLSLSLYYYLLTIYFSCPREGNIFKELFL